MALTQSTEVAAQASLGILGDTRYGKTVPMLIPFNITIPASPGTGPAPQICSVPAGFKPRLVFFSTNGLSASAAVGLNCRIGDSGDDDRLMADVDSDAATSSINLAAAGYDYEYTADTSIVLTMTSGKTPVAAQKLSGFIVGSVRMAT